LDTTIQQSSRQVIGPCSQLSQGGLTGPGTVWLQTLPIARLAHQIGEYLPKPKNNG